MYTNNEKFNLGSTLLKILFFAIFVGLLFYLFPTNKDLTPFYTNQFRENISYMQDAARSYFTTDKLPTEVGKSVKITLKEMIGQNLVLPFVDKDGNSCHVYESYAEVTKEVNGYKLKINLTCGEESDYIVEILGCYDYGCNTCGFSSEAKETALEYEFTRSYDKEISQFVCPTGYNLKGNSCYRVSEEEKVEATAHYTDKYVSIVDADYTDGEQEKVELSVIITTTAPTKTKRYVPYKIKFIPGITSLVPLNVITETTGGGTYDCSTTERVCTTHSSPSYPCNCKVRIINGRSVTVCDTCGGGSYTTCNDVRVPRTCTYPIKTSYKCPAEATSSTGSGSSLKCFKTITTEDQTMYYCPEDIDGSESSGVNLKCYYLDIVPGKKVYSCPKDTDLSEGKDETLKCYKYTQGEKQYYCKDTSYTLDPVTKKCSKIIESRFSHYSCPDSSYTLNGNMCSKTTTERINADTYTYTKTYTETKWSRNKTLWGWTATGRTRIVTKK